jgi:hypothetical protein
MGNKKKNKNDASGTDGNTKYGHKKKGRSGMREKQEDDRKKTLELDSSPAWDQDNTGNDATHEADGVPEASTEPNESTQPADAVATEPVKTGYLQDKSSKQDPDIAETEPEPGDVSDDILPTNQAPINALKTGDG